MDPTGIRRVFVLGPTHHLYLKGCAVSSATVCETPLGSLRVDNDTVMELLSNEGPSRTPFESLSIEDDEEEHSIELHLPWIAHTFGTDIPIVPILVGSLNSNSREYGELFSRYLDDPANFFVLSSDFCHWGARFGYTPIVQKSVEIHKSIEKLDQMGMEAIESLDPDTYTRYQKKYENTICGRHVITLFLQANLKSTAKLQMKFVNYSQSSKCVNPSDSSVSYAAGVFFK